MKSIRSIAILALACLAATAGVAHSKGKLVSVVPVGDGCAQAPDGPANQFWEVQPGKTYELTIEEATDCANGGTDATIGIRVNAIGPGFIDLVAHKVDVGIYKFTFTIPANAVCTMPLFYCTPPGLANLGLRVLRSEDYPAHLRMASFGPGCTNPTKIEGPDCSPVPARSRTWAQVKQFYR